MHTENDYEEAGVAQRRGPRRGLLVGVIAVAILLAACAAFVLAKTTGGESKKPVAVVSAAPVTEKGELKGEEADDTVEHIVTVPFEPVETSDDLEKRLGKVATGDYLAELEAQWQELTANGWTIEGKPEVVWTKTGKVADGKAELVACIDSSAVRTIDAKGKPIGESTAPPARHLFTLEQSKDGAWRIASHSFPDDPAC